MIRAATSLAGIGATWLALTVGPLGWPASVSFFVISLCGLGFVMALSNTALGQPSPTEAARLIILTHRGIAAPGRWMARTVRALAFKPSSQPVMIRYRTRLQDREARAALAHALNAAPGLVVVDAEADALLIHAIEDDDANADRAIKALETAAEAQP